MNKNNIFDLINDLHGIQPVKVSTSKGGEYHSPCPGCGGKDRFHIWTAQNDGEGSFWCRGCGKGGDGIQFLRDFSGLSFKEAASRVGRKLETANCIYRSFPSRKENSGWCPERKKRSASVVSPETWEKHAGKFINTCHVALLESKQHMAWLLNRGITKDYVIKWKLGLHVTKEMRPSFRPRTAWGLTGGTNNKTGRPFMFVLPAGITIPCVDGKGVVQRVRIRLDNIDPSEPKKRYHAVAGSRMNTFLTRGKASVYVIVETELDAIMLDCVAGDLVGVIALGSSHAKPTDEAGEAIKQACRVINALDYDTAGANASKWWLKIISHSIRRPVPVGCDPGEFFEQTGREEVREWIVKGLPPAIQRSIFKADNKKLDKNQFVSTLGGRCGLQQAKAHSPLLGDHPKVLHLKELLHLCPVVIKKTSSYYGLVALEGYEKRKHWDVFSKISQLVFSEPSMSYLHGLQDRIITAENIIQKTRTER